MESRNCQIVVLVENVWRPLTFVDLVSTIAIIEQVNNTSQGEYDAKETRTDR